jgi:hypothetical protein
LIDINGRRGRGAPAKEWAGTALERRVCTTTIRLDI